MKKLIRLWHTVKYLKLIQLYYQLRVRLLPKQRPKPLSDSSSNKSFPLTLIDSGILLTPSLVGINTFNLLNIEHSFDKKIDWNLTTYGKLWTYNLTYFEFLNQEDINKEYALELILNYIRNSDTIKDGNEPYPVSLRCINWIKFICTHKVNNEVNNSLFMQFNYLSKNLEYHLLGNHLLENAFSLLLGSCYFRNEQFYNKAKSLLIKQLIEQVLDDGGHFELSPMYHKIVLFRLLDAINLIENNNWKEDDLLDFLKQKAQLMLGWLETMTYTNGETGNVNDSATGIAPSTNELSNYAKKLNLQWHPQKLNDSGYRVLKNNKFELLIDIGNIGPDYIPGHAHADTFNFELIIDGKPVIVDTGISTYEKNSIRTLERSTKSHNTVEVAGQNQSDVWGGFRVGKRAKIISLKETEDLIEASHNGYRNLGVVHTRSFQLKENKVIIKDKLIGRSKQKYSSKAFLHFYPSVNIELYDSVIKVQNSSVEIKLINANKISIDNYNYCEGFNKTTTSQMAIIEFNESLITTISIKS